MNETKERRELRDGDEFIDRGYRNADIVTVVGVRAETWATPETVRIEWPNGTVTDTGLTVEGFLRSPRWERYAFDRGTVPA